MNQHSIDRYEIGLVFDDLTIIGYEVNEYDSRRLYKVKCNCCGREKVKNRKELRKGVGTSHQACSNAVAPADPRFYRLWQGMRSRTTNKNQKSYIRGYGKISSDEYRYFIDFYDDMWESYILHREDFGEKNTTLDRINPELDYTKDNLRWATIAEQNNNTKKHLIKYKATNVKTGEEVIFSNQKVFANSVGISPQGVNSVIKGRLDMIKNWMIEKL